MSLPAVRLIRSSDGGEVERHLEEAGYRMKVEAIGEDRKGETKTTRKRKETQGMEIRREAKALYLSTALLSGKCHLVVLQMRL